jgi:16S rRNA (adenine1518-N6/adenine1519-N6)-dimethyltransferase
VTLGRSRITDLLDSHGLAPSRALGQNFLADPAMIDKIVRLARVEADQPVVEIGPGLGSLTLGLCRAGARVTAIEVDRYLIAPLREVVGHHEQDGQLRIVNEDVRTVDWDELLDGDTTVVANLPYNIATPLILDLMAGQPRLNRWLVMVQREAGERLVAGPGSKIYGIPSVLLAYWATGRIVGSVGAELFVPRPNVESVLVGIERTRAGSVDDDPLFRRLSTLVRTGFGQRRKMLRRSLADLVTPEQMEAAGIDPTSRPEQLGLESWEALARLAP